jgi:hypothetical protein
MEYHLILRILADPEETTLISGLGERSGMRKNRQVARSMVNLAAAIAQVDAHVFGDAPAKQREISRLVKV